MTASTASNYDAVIVGARVAGASTALLLARSGLRVLVLDRAEPGTDTLSTHALTRGGVMLLHQWDVLDELIRLGTPPVCRTTFHYGHESFGIDIEPKDGVDALLAPRRTVLDPVLAAAAQEAGADVRYGCRATSLIVGDTGRMNGVAFTDAAGNEQVAHGSIIIGADGSRSLVAREAGARTVWTGTHAGAMLYGHFPDPGVDGYHWFYNVDATAGIIPTNDGRVCAWVGTPSKRFMADFRGDPGQAFTVLLGESAPDYVGALPVDQVETRLFGYSGQVGYLRDPCGPGWALVGDAGYFKDPLTAHGVTDALRDSQCLASAIIDSPTDDAIMCRRYREQRELASTAFADVTDRIASYSWDLDEIKALVREEGVLLAEEATALAPG
jgi:flavin-dependent dehydrogenase